MEDKDEGMMLKLASVNVICLLLTHPNDSFVVQSQLLRLQMCYSLD